MDHRENELLDTAAEYCRLTGRGLSGLALTIYNDSKKFKNLKNGASCRPETHEKGMRWFKENWHKTQPAKRKSRASQSVN